MLSRSYGFGVLFSGIVHAIPLVVISLTAAHNISPLQVIPIEFKFEEQNLPTLAVDSMPDPQKPMVKSQTLDKINASTDNSVTCKQPSLLNEPEATVQNVVLDNDKPLYPEEARLLGVHGIVKIEIVIERGILLSAKIQESPHNLLSSAALEKIRQWTFPNHCRRTTLVIPIEFELI